MTTQNSGRKAGAKNKYNAKQKDEMREIFLPRLKELTKSMATMEPVQKVKVLLDFLPYFLPKGVVTDDENEVQTLIYEQLEWHYKRLGIYFNQVPQEKKAALLKSYMALFSTKQNAAILPTIKQQIRVKEEK